MTSTLPPADLAPELLKKERSTATFEVQSCIDLVHGSRQHQARRKQLFDLVVADPVLSDREMNSRNHHERYTKALEKAHAFIQLLKKNNITDQSETTIVYQFVGEPLPIDVHRAMFVPTLETQMDDEQRAYWLPKAESFEITGAYAQTELGHGSNVQGIETTAHYDVKTQEFILNSPTLTSRKWWPGGLGKTANHCVLHARLFLNGKDHGIQAFLVPIRDTKTHESLPGVTLGDIGPKIGFQSIDNGFCALNNVRIPRRNMLMRFAKVAPDGSFSKPPMDKLVYFTMVKVRVYIVFVAFRSLAAAATIGTRFSAARVQGTTGKGKPENQVLNYENQQLTLFPLIGLAYACLFSSRVMDALYNKVISQLDGDIEMEHLYLLSQLHASASGLKALLTEEAANGIERIRRACGGHGYSAASNLPYIFQEFIGACTYEGTKDVLVQQHGAFLLKCLRNPVPVSNSTSLDLLGFLQVDANSTCPATRPEQLRDPEILLAAFKVRALKALLRADANKKSLHFVTQASLAHADSIVLSCFYDGILNVQDPKLRGASLQLFQLYGLWRIQANLGEFRFDNYLSAAQGEWVQDEVLALLKVVRPNAITLVDGFGFTDFELNSAIGRYDGDIYRALIDRASKDPLNKTDVVPGYHQYLKPLLSAKL
ncbi:unnamed protein product [Aphanomyces euteiches]|uniref:Acyl-coenzyme A oxidase n=1 Tax=Aphanomyces euteiches TaxID=100861 RepID=A0A6G0WIQ4_9STRA|nr:hypothetical protein Ae201684_014820 [Aphanomyces euteiches]KAH9072634.1 hypothetical protein Ae201684P_015709 [Aphanomyces euteiches]KAH9141971.1 hypothetical protein AeRB84_013909 [Aphanomyces euteiches]